MDFLLSKRTQRGFFGEQPLSVALFFSLAAVCLASLSMWVPLSFVLCSSPSLLLPRPLLRIIVFSRTIPQLPPVPRDLPVLSLKLERVGPLVLLLSLQ